MRGDRPKRNRAYRQLIAAQFSTVTPENEMKWEAIEPERGEFEFGAADDIVERAREARPEDPRPHARLALPAAGLGARARAEATCARRRASTSAASMDHYKDDVGVWDVVNEPISDRGGLRPSVFARRP